MKGKTNVSFIGFMGSGKTTIGQVVAANLGYDFVDMDHYIEEKAGKTISKIFEETGEPYFRELEKEALRELIQRENTVISTGGGVVIDEANRKLLNEHTFVVYLSAKPQNIYYRIKNGTARPLLNTEKPLKKIKKMMHQREKYYKEHDICVVTDDLHVGAIVEEVILRYREQ
jgi:shikimate kinase